MPNSHRFQVGADRDDADHLAAQANLSREIEMIGLKSMLVELSGRDLGQANSALGFALVPSVAGKQFAFTRGDSRRYHVGLSTQGREAFGRRPRFTEKQGGCAVGADDLCLSRNGLN